MREGRVVWRLFQLARNDFLASLTRVGSDGHSKTWMDSKYILGFPGGSAGKDSACSAGDLDLIPELERSPGILPGEFHGLYSPWGHKESDTTKQLSLSFGGKIDKTW